MEANRLELEGSDPSSLAVDNSSEQRDNQWKAWLREIVETLLLAIVIWVGVNATTARFVVEGTSMEPNFHTGEFVIVSRIAYWKVIGEPQRGDVVVFHPPTNPNEDYIKRVVGLPGDVVEVREGQVYVNDALLEEPYLAAPTTRSGLWVIGDAEYFVMGDNRHDSDDSRNWGALDKQLIVGKAWLIYWPPREWGLVPHEDVATIPGPAQAAGPAVPTPTAVPPEVTVVVGGEGLPTESPPTALPSTPTPQGMVGSIVMVAQTGGNSLAVRIGPGLGYSELFWAEDGETYVVEDGPEARDGHTWWYIVDPNDPDKRGWSASEYLLKVP